MFGSTILEVAIGLVLVYLLLSLICSALQESLEGWFKVRATHLEQGLRVLLQDTDGTQLLSKLYNHPLIYGLFSGDYDPAKLRSKWTRTTTLPSYMPAASFATALIDTIVRGPVESDPEKKNPSAGEITCDSLRAAVVNSVTLTAPIQRVLLLALDSAHGDLAKAQANVEAWFNSGMDRVSGWYKRQTQWVLLGLGLVIAIALNVDTLKIAAELYRNDTLRAAAVAQASGVAKDGKLSPELQDKALKKLEELKLPIGWYIQKTSDDPLAVACSVKEILLHFPGWLITAFAISFGAPFWFDLLNKLMQLRSTVKPQEKSREGATSNQNTVQNQRQQQQDATAALGDEEYGADGCDVFVTTATPDDELPASEGGVASHA